MDFTVKSIGRNKAIVIPGWAEKLNERMGLPSTNAKLYEDSIWAQRCIGLRADALSAIPWGIRPPDEEAEFLPEKHPAMRLLNEVNDEMNWVDLIRATSKDLDIEGRAYWEKLGNGRLVTGLLRLNPVTMKNKADREGLKGFEQKVDNKAAAQFGRKQVVYFHDYDPRDDFGGRGKIAAAKESIKADVAATEYLEGFFRNGAIPALVVTTDATVGEEELKKKKRLWDRWFRGARNSGKTAFVDQGLKAEVIGFNVEQLAMGEVRSETRKDICAAFGVPPALVGAEDTANWKIDEMRQSLYTETIFPGAEYLAAVINAELIRPHFGELRFEWKFGDLPFMQEDTNAKGAMLARAVEVGAITPDAFVSLMDFPQEFMGTGSEQANPEPDQVDEPQEEERVNGAGREEEIRAVIAEVAKSRPMLGKDEIGDVEADLDTWRRKSLKRLAEGKAASCTFESKHIPETLNVAVEELLKGSEGEEDVHRVFHNAVMWREREPLYGG